MAFRLLFPRVKTRMQELLCQLIVRNEKPYPYSKLFLSPGYVVESRFEGTQKNKRMCHDNCSMIRNAMAASSLSKSRLGSSNNRNDRSTLTTEQALPLSMIWHRGQAAPLCGGSGPCAKPPEQQQQLDWQPLKQPQQQQQQQEPWPDKDSIDSNNDCWQWHHVSLLARFPFVRDFAWCGRPTMAVRN
jgi:hypothetical protein